MATRTRFSPSWFCLLPLLFVLAFWAHESGEGAREGVVSAADAERV